MPRPRPDVTSESPDDDRPASFRRVDELCIAITLTKAASLLGVTPAEVEALVAAGRLRTIVLPGSGRLRIPLSEVEAIRAT